MSSGVYSGPGGQGPISSTALELSYHQHRSATLEAVALDLGQRIRDALEYINSGYVIERAVIRRKLEGDDGEQEPTQRP
jgi:hypothetical protein